MVVIIQHVAILKAFRKDEDLVEKTFSVHAEVFQSIAMCLKPKKIARGQQGSSRPGRKQLSQASLKLDDPW